jgi:hypothetical protein
MARAGSQGRPSFEHRRPLDLAEVPATGSILAWAINATNSYVRCYRLGDCKAIVTRECGFWHLSVSHRDRYPTWDEIAEARYRLLPGDIYAALVLPPKGEYVNLNENCFQLMEIADPMAGRAATP